MKQKVTVGIVLARTNYGEADRILTVLTSDQGKIRLLAKGVRRIKSRLAGGIELFSINDITYIEGRGDLNTLISARVFRNFGDIVKDVNRTMFTYEVLKQINKLTEDSPEQEYYIVLARTLQAINNPKNSLDAIALWLHMQLLRL
ncbi:MAG: repair protein RecO, partial [Patescibacteria group bacterium]|nr:repair protein RecO [Patescibacteria group bacterium]